MLIEEAMATLMCMQTLICYALRGLHLGFGKGNFYPKDEVLSKGTRFFSESFSDLSNQKMKMFIF